MSARFTPAQTVDLDGATVEIGRRSGAPAFKVIIGGITAVFTEEETNLLADVLDDALDVFEADPLLWQGGS